MIGTREFDQARTLIRRAGVADTLEVQLRPTPGGRRRALSVEVLLTAMLLCFTRHQTLAMTRVHQLLTTELPRRLANELGLHPGAQRLTIRQVRYLWNEITDLFEHTVARRPDLDPVERAGRADALDAFTDAILTATSAHLPDTGSWAVDETAIDSAGRARRRNAQAPTTGRAARGRDVDARWGYRTETYDNRTSRVFGFQMVAFTRVGAIECDEPLLTSHIRVVPGNQNGVPQTLQVIDDRTRTGSPVTEVIADRGFTYVKRADWADQLLARGVAQVMDIHPNDHGPRVHPTAGYLMIDGWAHCPSIPDHLKHIERPTRLSVPDLPNNPTREQIAQHTQDTARLAEFQELIAQRRTYRFEKNGKTKSGAQRFICPARAGKVKCGGCPFSRNLPGDLPEVNPPNPDDPPKACRQETITIGDTVDTKLRQADYWGSPEWIRSYNRRTRVEGSFGLLKSPKTGGVRRGWIHQVGLVKTAFALTMAVAAVNLHQLLAWARRTGNTADPLTTMDVTTLGFEEIQPDGSDTSGASPPAAA